MRIRYVMHFPLYLLCAVTDTKTVGMTIENTQACSFKVSYKKSTNGNTLMIYFICTKLFMDLHSLRMFKAYYLKDV